LIDKSLGEGSFFWCMLQGAGCRVKERYEATGDRREAE